MTGPPIHPAHWSAPPPPPFFFCPDNSGQLELHKDEPTAAFCVCVSLPSFFFFFIFRRIDQYLLALLKLKAEKCVRNIRPKGNKKQQQFDPDAATKSVALPGEIYDTDVSRRRRGRRQEVSAKGVAPSRSAGPPRGAHRHSHKRHKSRWNTGLYAWLRPDPANRRS